MRAWPTTINNLPDIEKSEGKLTKLQEQINHMAANERKGKKQTKDNKKSARGK